MNEERRSGWRRLAKAAAGPAAILFAAAVAASPDWFYAYSCGHDFDFHLLSWIEALRYWRQGLFYPHWAISPNYFAGEPRFVFYPPVTWMLGAGLRLGMEWGRVPLVIAWGMFAAAGLGTRKLALEVVGDGAATLAGCTTIFSGYALFTTFERCAYGEMTGGFWIPLLLLFALRDRNAADDLRRRALDGSAAWLTLVMAGVWLSNVPLGIMASYLLAAVALTAAVSRRNWAPVVRATIAAAVGIGLACVFLIPAAYEQRWVDIAQATNDPGSKIETSWMFARHADPALELHDTVLLKVSFIGATMLAVAFGALLIAWLRKRLKPGRVWWTVLALIPAAVLVLQLPVSLPVWNVVPKMRLLQFPWRWMVVLEAPMAILFAAALWPLKRWARAALITACAVFFVGATVFAAESLHQICDADDSISNTLAVFARGAGFEGTDEYAPPNADDSLVPMSMPGACVVSDAKVKLGAPSPDENPTWDATQRSCEQIFAAAWVKPEHMQVAAAVSHSGYLVLRLRSYPAWRVTVNGRAAGALPLREDGLIAVPVDAGVAKIDVVWTTTPDVIAGRWASGIALLLLLGLGWMETRVEHPGSGVKKG